jgi:hypothetical protein
MLNYYIKWNIIAAIAVMSLSCKGKSQEKWTPDMGISTHNGGGMIPESITVTIKGSSGTYIHWHQPKTDTVAFTLSKQELDNLMKEINTSHFRDIISG